MISSEKQTKLNLWMRQLNINENDIIEKFILGSGRGGQKINKTASSVYIKHLPTGIEVKCQESRSQEHNRYYARKRLCEELHSITSNEPSKKQQRIDKLKRQKQKRARKAKKKALNMNSTNEAE